MEITLEGLETQLVQANAKIKSLEKAILAASRQTAETFGALSELQGDYAQQRTSLEILQKKYARKCEELEAVKLALNSTTVACRKTQEQNDALRKELEQNDALRKELEQNDALRKELESARKRTKRK